MIYKVHKCDQCGFTKEIPPPAKGRIWCPKCGAFVLRPVSNNWNVRKFGVKKCTGPRLAAAQAEEAAIIKLYYEGQSLAEYAKMVPWSKARKKFEQFTKSHVKDKTLTFYHSRLDVLEGFFKPTTPLNKLTRADLDSYVDWRQDQVSETTINRDIYALRRFLTWAQERGMVRKNIASKYPLFGEAARKRILSPEEEERLLAACQDEDRPPYLYPMVLCALDGSLRRGDVLTLKRSELDFEGGFIVKKPSKQRKGSEKVVYIPMKARLREALKKWILGQKVASFLVFPSKSDPTQPMRVDSATSFHTACRKARIKGLWFHDLRRTFATRWAEAGGDMKALQDIMGHSNINITAKYYTHVSKAYLKGQMAKVDTAQAEVKNAGNNHDPGDPDYPSGGGDHL